MLPFGFCCHLILIGRAPDPQRPGGAQCMSFPSKPSEIFLARAAVCALIALPLLAAQTQKAPGDAPRKDTHGIVAANMDTSVKPGDDFDEYSNGGWIKRTEIPPDRSNFGVFSALADLSNKRTAGLIEEAAKANAPAGSNLRKIADLYSSYMDEAAIEAIGLAPLRPHLESIAAIHNKRELARALGETLRSDVDALNNTNFHTANLFGLWVAPGFNDSERYAAYLLQGGLELPDREYYLGGNERMLDLRAKYQAHVSAMLKLAGFTDADSRAKGIVELEHAIAEKHISLAEDEDIHKANNTWTQADFAAKAPGLDWAEYFRGAGLGKQPSFIVWQPAAFTGESALVASTSLDTWKDWLAYHLMEDYAEALPKADFDSASPSLAKFSRARRSSVRDGSAASRKSTKCLAMPSGKSMRSAISRRKQKLRRRPWLPTLSPRSGSVLRRCPGWILQPKRRRKRSCPHCTWESATRRPGAIIPLTK